jgi:hypothetical protein
VYTTRVDSHLVDTNKRLFQGTGMADLEMDESMVDKHMSGKGNMYLRRGNEHARP